MRRWELKPELITSSSYLQTFSISTYTDLAFTKCRCWLSYLTKDEN